MLGLLVLASLVVEHRLQGAEASVATSRRLGSSGCQAQLLLGMWNLPRPGTESMSPALAGRFLTSGPPGKSLVDIFVE